MKNLISTLLSVVLVFSCASSQVVNMPKTPSSQLTDFRLCLEAEMGQSETISGDVTAEIKNRSLDCTIYAEQVAEQIAIEEQRRVNETQNLTATIFGSTIFVVGYVAWLTSVIADAGS